MYSNNLYMNLGAAFINSGKKSLIILIIRSYNLRKTKECLSYFDDLEILHNEGDVIFPQGNATRYLCEYFEKKPIDMDFKCGDALYSTDLLHIDELSIDCNGDVIPCSFSIGNIYKDNIVDIIRNYNPFDNHVTKALVERGISGLIEQTKEMGIEIDLDKYYSPCELCNFIFKEM